MKTYNNEFLGFVLGNDLFYLNRIHSKRFDSILEGLKSSYHIIHA